MGTQGALRGPDSPSITIKYEYTVELGLFPNLTSGRFNGGGGVNQLPIGLSIF